MKKLATYRSSIPIEQLREKVRLQVAEWRRKNRDKNQKSARQQHLRYRIKYKACPIHKLSKKITKATSSFARHHTKTTGGYFFALATGLSRDEFSKLFPKKKGYQFDHIIPLCAFSLIDPPQLLKACHLSNLRYVPFSVNASKGKKIPNGLDISTLPFNGLEIAMLSAERFIGAYGVQGRKIPSLD